MNQELQRRLLFIIHRGLVEARLLAQAKKCEQLFDLTDAIEIIPSYMDNWDNNHLELIRSSLKAYCDKYQSPSFDYLKYLDIDPSPPRF